MDRDISSEFDIFIKELANLESIQWEESDKESPPSSIFVLNELKILIPLEGLIDPKKESIRLQKKIEELDKEKNNDSFETKQQKFCRKCPKRISKKIKSKDFKNYQVRLITLIEK